MKKFFVLTSILFSTSLLAQSMPVLSAQQISTMMEHKNKMNQAENSFFTNLAAGHTLSALRDMKNYFDLVDMPEFTPVIGKFILSTVSNTPKTCEGYYKKLDYIIFDKAVELVDTEVVSEKYGVALTQYDFRTDVINAVVTKELEEMKAFCSAKEYEENIIKLNKSRRENIFSYGSSDYAIYMVNKIFESNNIRQFVEL
jgi:hypothetical protein